jgi:hypothetical protein
MARIPMGNFGNAIAAPPPRTRIPAGAYSEGAGLAQVGDALSDVSANIFAEEKQRQDEEKRQQQALDRARAANLVLDHEIAVDGVAKQIEQQVSSGEVQYAEAPTLYQKRVKELGAPAVEGMDPVTAENFSKGMKRIEFKGQGAIDGVVSKARVADFRSQADGILDKLGKKAGLPGADMAAVSAQIDAMDDVGRQAYGAGWEKRKQDWRDNTWDAQLNQQAMATRDSLQGINALQKRITEGDYSDKLDSNRRNSLVAKLDGYKTSLIQRNEAAASRAARQQELALKRAEAEFNTFQSMADKGTILAPEYVDRAVQMTAGTPYQAGIVAVARQAQETGGIAAQPIRNQQAMLTQVDAQIAQRGRTPELDKRREQIGRVLEASQADLKENGLRAGLERGVITDMAPLDISTPEAMAASFGRRIEQAEHVSAWAGKPVSPLDADEAEQVRGILEALPAKQRSAAVAVIAQAVGPRYAGAISQQMDSKDKPLALAFATAGDKTSAGRYTSELILKGATAIKDGAVMKDDKKVTGWRATISAELDGAFPDERATSAAKDAAYYIAAGIAQENGGSVSGADLQRAVRLAVGGSIIERNGKKLPIPAGMDDGDFEDRLRNVPASAIAKQAPDGKVRVGGVDMPAEAFAASIPGQELIYAGSGRYAVVVRGRPVTNSQGRPIFVEVR